MDLQLSSIRLEAVERDIHCEQYYSGGEGCPLDDELHVRAVGIGQCCYCSCLIGICRRRYGLYVDPWTRWNEAVQQYYLERFRFPTPLIERDNLLQISFSLHAYRNTVMLSAQIGIRCVHLSTNPVNRFSQMCFVIRGKHSTISPSSAMYFPYIITGVRALQSNPPKRPSFTIHDATNHCPEHIRMSLIQYT